METYQIFVVPIGKTNHRINIFHPRVPVVKYQARYYLDYKEAPKDSVAPSDNIEKFRKGFCGTKC